jgi:glycosyltransferase involved in cell wall biosynthesis
LLKIPSVFTSHCPELPTQKFKFIDPTKMVEKVEASDLEFPIPYQESFLNFKRQIPFKLCDYFIALNRIERDKLVELGIPAGRIRIISNGVSAQFEQDCRKAFRSTYRIEQPYMLFVGQLEPRKGVDYLLRAYSMLPAELQKTAQLVLVSYNPGMLKDYRNLAEKLGITERVKFLIKLEMAQLIGAYQCSEFVVLPSLCDLFSMVIVEAMSCGKAVIGTRAGGTPDVIEEGKNGLLVPPADAKALAAALQQLLEKTSLREAMGAEGKRRFQERFRWEKIADITLQYYQDILRAEKCLRS